MRAILFIYCNFIFYIFSKSNYSNDVLLMFDPSCIWIYIFWNLNISIITRLSPSKVSFSLHSFEVLKTCFLIWIMNAFCVCNMVKHNLNILWGNHNNEFKKWKAMFIFYLYFVQNGTITPNQEKGVCMLWFTKKNHNLTIFSTYLNFMHCGENLKNKFHWNFVIDDGLCPNLTLGYEINVYTNDT
jgi:hypothetical protein